MSKRVALILYVLFLVVTVMSLLIVMPKELIISYGKDKVCSNVGFLKSLCTALPLPASKSVTLKRPTLAFSIAGLTITRDLELKEGLDIKGGTQVTLKADMSAIAEGDRDRALDTAQEVLNRRINLYGVSEAVVQQSKTNGEYRLIAEIPGVDDSAQAVELLGSTAFLDFREYKPSTGSAQIASTSSVLIKDFKPTGLSGKDLARSTVEFDPQNGKPSIGIQFTSEGASKFAAITKRNIGKPLSIFLDDYPITSPVVQSEIADGKAQISGDFTLEQAKSLSIALNAGALPAPIQAISQKTIGATLGNRTVQLAVRAGVIGVGIVMLFMVMLYDRKGLLSVISLLFYGLITLSLYKLIPVTLSLAGIAGFLLSMGMAVDTNILVFERLREEEERLGGKSQKALEGAFSRAWNSIKDANITTLITCFVLANPFDWGFLSRTGVVRGFAFTLALGVLVNLLCGMIVSRVLLTLFYGTEPKSEKN